LPPPLLSDDMLEDFKDRYADLPKHHCDYDWLNDVIDYYKDPNSYVYLFIHLYPHSAEFPSVAI